MNIVLPCYILLPPGCCQDEHAGWKSSHVATWCRHQPWNRNVQLQTVSRHRPTNRVNLVPVYTSTANKQCATVESIKCSSVDCKVSTTLMQISISLMTTRWEPPTPPTHYYGWMYAVQISNTLECDFHLRVGVTWIKGGMWWNRSRSEVVTISELTIKSTEPAET